MIYQILRDQNPQFRTYLGRYLRHKRQEHGFTQEQTATQLTMTKANYQRIENGRMKIKNEDYDVLAGLFKIDPSDVIELSKVANIAWANSVAKELSGNYPA